MKRSKRIQSVADIAKDTEQHAARQLGEKRQYLEQQRLRLDELIRYREEYTVKFQSSGSQGFNARQLGEYRLFLEKLNQAIVQQRDLINQANGECHVCQENWMSKRTHSQALDKVVAQYHAEEVRDQERKEQKVQDEHASRKGVTRLDD